MSRTYACPFCKMAQHPEGEVNINDILFCIECGSVIGKITQSQGDEDESRRNHKTDSGQIS